MTKTNSLKEYFLQALRLALEICSVEKIVLLLYTLI